jgi:hypothetical protein
MKSPFWVCIPLVLAACGSDDSSSAEHVASLLDEVIAPNVVANTLSGNRFRGYPNSPACLSNDALLYYGIERDLTKGFTTKNDLATFDVLSRVWVVDPGTGTCPRGQLACEWKATVAVSKSGDYRLTDRLKARYNWTYDSCGTGLNGEVLQFLDGTLRFPDGSLNLYSIAVDAPESLENEPFDGWTFQGGHWAPYEVCGKVGSENELDTDPWPCQPSCGGSPCWWFDAWK